MLLDARLKQGLPKLAATVKVNEDLELMRVVAATRQRELRHVAMLAFVGAVAALVLFFVGGRVADMVLGIDVPLPTVDQSDDELDEKPIEDRTDPELDQRLPQRDDPAPDVGGPSADTTKPRLAVVRSQPQRNEMDAREKKDDPPTLPTRTDQGGYSGSAVPVSGGVSSCEQNVSGQACVRFHTDPGERDVDISITDTAGGPVYAAVQIDRDGDGAIDGEWTWICSETETPVAIPSDGDAVVYVEIFRGTCRDGSGRQSSPVSGTVTARFST